MHQKTTTPAPARFRKPPSNRDLEIYKRVRIKGHEQWEVAREHNLHYSRVSQIVKRVTHWLAVGGCPTDPLLREHAARLRLASASLKLRLTRAVELASLNLEFPASIESTRRRVQGPTELWREETSSNVPRVNRSALKLLIDATHALQKIEQQEQLCGDAPPLSEEDIVRTVFELLCGLRARAEAQGTRSPASNIRASVAAALASLLGSSVVQVCPVTLPPPAKSTGSLGCAHQSSPDSSQAISPSAQAPPPVDQPDFPDAQEPLNLNAPQPSNLDATPLSQ